MNLHCDLDLQNNNLIFTQISPAYDDVPSNKMWLQKDQQFSKYGKTVILDYMSPHCDSELKDGKPIFLYDTLAHDAASKIGYRRFSSGRDIIQMNSHRNSEHFL